MRLKKYGRPKSRFAPDPNAEYRKCPRCGGKYIKEQMRLVGDQLICGCCFLLQLAEVERKE